MGIRETLGNFILGEGKEVTINNVLLETEKGYSVMKKVKVIDGEIIQKESGIWKKDLDDIYTGEPPQIIEFHREVLPWIRKRIFWKHIPKVVRLRVYHRLFDEPMTRDLYTGSFLNSEKKRKVLVERGILDDQGFLMEKYQIKSMVDGKEVLIEKTRRKEVQKGVWVKPDVSDIDFIKAEYHAKLESKEAEKITESMSKTGQSFDKWYYIVLMVAFGVVALTVLVYSGVF